RIQNSLVRAARSAKRFDAFGQATVPLAGRVSLHQGKAMPHSVRSLLRLPPEVFSHSSAENPNTRLPARHWAVHLAIPGRGLSTPPPSLLPGPKSRRPAAPLSFPEKPDRDH